MRFIALIDRLSDRLYPVTVLEWRREFRSAGQGILYAGLYCWIAIAAIAGFVFETEVETWFRDVFQQSHKYERLFWIVVVFYLYLLGLVTFINFFVSLGRSFQWRDAYKKLLPDLYLAPMDRKTIFFGCCQWWLLRMVALHLKLLPWFAFAWALQLLPISWALFYPTVFWALFFTLGNLSIPLFAFSVHSQKKQLWWKEFLMGFGGTVFAGILLGIPIILIVHVIQAFCEVYVMHRPLSHFNGIVDFRYWFPMFLVGVTVFNAAVWPLARLVMRKDGTGPKKLLVIYGVYLLIALSIAGLWFLLWFLFR